MERTIWIVRTGESRDSSPVGCRDEKRRKERKTVRSGRGGIADGPSRAATCPRPGRAIVEQLDKTLLVEFSDEEGRAYAVGPCPRADLLVLHFVPEPA